MRSSSPPHGAAPGSRLGGWLAGLLAVPVAVAGTSLPETTPETSRPSMISVIIDDMGYRRSDGLRALELPGPVTYSFLPHTPHAESLARLAYELGKEVLLHLPLEAQTGNHLGPGGLTTDMTRQEMARSLRESVASVPHAVGVNNHMGSRFTAERRPMRWLFEALHEQSELFYIDSRTAPGAISRDIAAEIGIAFTGRDVFLDNRLEAGYIERRFRELVAIAHRHGTALGIGHPHPETIAVLRRELARLDHLGVELVPTSVLLGRRLGRGSGASTGPAPAEQPER